jgi:hypothetical protein
MSGPDIHARQFSPVQRKKRTPSVGRTFFTPASYHAARNGKGGYHAAMRRRLFTLLSALSLALCVVTAVLWVRSYSSLEGFFWAPDLPHEFEIGSRRGTIYFGYDVDIGYDVSIGRSSKRRTGFASIDIRGDAHLWVPSEWNVLGFGLHKDNFAHWVGPIRKSGHAL